MLVSKNGGTAASPRSLPLSPPPGMPEYLLEESTSPVPDKPEQEVITLTRNRWGKCHVYFSKFVFVLYV